MTTSPVTLSIANCLLAQVDQNSMNLPLKLLSEKQGTLEIIKEGFLDCGAGGKFIDQNYVKKNHFKKQTLSPPIKVYNVDGTPNKQGTINY